MRRPATGEVTERRVRNHQHAGSGSLQRTLNINLASSHFTSQGCRLYKQKNIELQMAGKYVMQESWQKTDKEKVEGGEQDFNFLIMLSILLRRPCFGTGKAYQKCY